MNNKTLKSVEEMDETTIEIVEDKKESAFDQTHQSNRIARKVKEKQKVVEEMQDEMHDQEQWLSVKIVMK